MTEALLQACQSLAVVTPELVVAEMRPHAARHVAIASMERSVSTDKSDAPAATNNSIASGFSSVIENPVFVRL